MLKSLTLTNWKSFGEQRNRLDFAPLTLLVGPNASGKSNVLDALRFLQGAAMDYPLSDVLRGRWEGQREVWPAIRGQIVEAARNGGAGFALRTEWHDPMWEGREHQIQVNSLREVVVRAEHLREQVRHDGFEYHENGDGPAELKVQTFGQHRPATQPCSPLRSMLGQVRVESDSKLVRQVQRDLRQIVFLDVQPGRMRDYQPEHAAALGVSAENISPILSALTTEQRADIVAWLSELCAPKVEDIAFDITQLKEVMLFLKEGEHTRISARSASDGTLRFLGLVTALLTAEPGSLIVLEEPDVGLHPARIHLLARLLEQVTANGNIQVLATTHSPVLLAHLSPESLANVVALARDSDGTSVCSRLGDLPHFATLRDSGRLDHLIATGWIERAV